MNESLGTIDYRSLDSACRERIARLGPKVAQFLNDNAAFVHVTVGRGSDGTDPKLQVLIDDRVVDEMTRGLPPGLAIRPGRHVLSVRARSSLGGESPSVRLLADGVNVVASAGDEARFPVDLTQGSHEIEVSMYEGPRACVLLERIVWDLDPVLEEQPPTVILHGAGTSRVLMAPEAVFPGTYALQVVRAPEAVAQADVLVELEGVPLSRRQTKGAGLRHILPVECASQHGQRATLRVRIEGWNSGLGRSIGSLGAAESPSMSAMLAWGGGGVAAAGLVLAATAYWGWQVPAERASERAFNRSQCGAGISSENCSESLLAEGRSAQARAESYVPWANLGLGLAGVGAVALGAAWYLTTLDEGEPASEDAAFAAYPLISPKALSWMLFWKF